MGREIFYCANCGARILPEEFDSGEAIALNNQNYCPNCKPLVAPEMPAPVVSSPAPLPEDAPTGSSALRRAVRAPLPTMTTGRGGTGLVGRHQTTSPLRTPAVGRGPAGYAGSRAPAKSNTVLFVVIGAAVVVLILVVALLSSSRKRDSAGSAGGGDGRPAPRQPVLDPPTKADFERLRTEVYDMLKSGRKADARSRVEAYRARYPGFDLDKVQKLSDEIEVW